MADGSKKKVIINIVRRQQRKLEMQTRMAFWSTLLEHWCLPFCVCVCVLCVANDNLSLHAELFNFKIVAL